MNTLSVAPPSPTEATIRQNGTNGRSLAEMRQQSTMTPQISDEQYIEAIGALFGTPDKAHVKCRTTTVVTVGEERECQCPIGARHLIASGERAVLDRAIADGRWSTCYVCLPCLEAFVEW